MEKEFFIPRSTIIPSLESFSLSLPPFPAGTTQIGLIFMYFTSILKRAVLMKLLGLFSEEPKLKPTCQLRGKRRT